MTVYPAVNGWKGMLLVVTNKFAEKLVFECEQNLFFVIKIVFHGYGAYLGFLVFQILRKRENSSFTFGLEPPTKPTSVV